MQEVDDHIPSHFLCPISMLLMKDPVTVSTGITYDRYNIEKWIFSCNNNSCPVTKQPLPDPDLTPNHTLRRLIQSWCILNNIDRIPTPKQPLDKAQILKLLKQPHQSPQSQLKSLQTIRSIIHSSPMNKSFLEQNGVVQLLVSILKSINSNPTEIIDEALCILLLFSDTFIKGQLSDSDSSPFLHSLVCVLKLGNHTSRGHAIMLLKSILTLADPAQLINIDHDLVAQVVHVLQENISLAASKSALKLLIEICKWGRNRIRAVEANAMHILIELLLDTNIERRLCELLLVLLDMLCGCAEGREAFVKHAAGLAVVSKKVLRVSHVGTDRAIRVLSLVCRFSGNSRVLQEMLQVGVVSKLCLVVQMDCSGKTKERVEEMLRLHSRVWRDAPCIPSHLSSSYPSS